MTTNGFDERGDALGALRDPAGSVPPMSAELREALAGARPRGPRRPHRQLAVVVGASLAYAGAVVAALSLRPDLGTLPLGWVIGHAALWLVCFVTLCYAALVPRAGEVMPRWRGTAILAAAATLAVAGAGFAWVPAEADVAVVHAPTLGATLGHGQGCIKVGVAAAVIPLLITALAIRGAVPAGSRWIGFAVGVAGGSLAGLILHFYCGVTTAAHLALIHPVMVILAGLLGALVVPRITA